MAETIEVNKSCLLCTHKRSGGPWPTCALHVDEGFILVGAHRHLCDKFELNKKLQIIKWGTTMKQPTELITDVRPVITKFLQDKPLHKTYTVFTVKDLFPGGRRTMTSETHRNRLRLAKWLLNGMKQTQSVEVDGWVLSVFIRSQPFKYRAERTTGWNQPLNTIPPSTTCDYRTCAHTHI